MTQKLHEWIKSVINSTSGLTQKGLAEAMNLNPAAVNRMLYGARQIKVDELPIIEAYLGQKYNAEAEDILSFSHIQTNRQDVFGGSDLNAQIPMGFRERKMGTFNHNHDIDWASMMVPVYGHPTGSIGDNLNLSDGEIVDWVVRHPGLNGIRDAFAVYVFSDTMEPRYYAGELVYIHPGRPPESNKDCVVELKNGQASLKRYLRQTETEVIVSQYNPQKDIVLNKSDIQAIYAVVGRT